MSAIRVLVGIGAAGLLGSLVFVFTGVYNIGADAPHWRMTRLMIDTFREKSIAARTKGITVPALDDPTMIAGGAEHYRAMCVTCHLAPGLNNTELREGLYPLPPSLVEHDHAAAAADDATDDAARQFWIIKHGIKMTSMPAAGKTHDDAAIWGIVAFLRKLPTMTPEDYEQLATEDAGHHHGEAEDAEHDTHEQAVEAPQQQHGDGAEDHVHDH